MRSLWLLTKKNLQLLVRTKASSLIIIFAPLLLILIMGLSFNTSEYGLSIGIVSSAASEDITKFTKVLEENQFTTESYTSLTDCTSDMKKNLVQTCIELPEKFNSGSKSAQKATFHIDPSRINLVWVIQDTVKEKFNLKSQEISQKLTQDILASLNDAKAKISSKKDTLNAAKEKSSSASTKTQTAKDALQGIDFTTSKLNYNTAIVTEIISDLKAIQTELEEIRDDVENSNATSSQQNTIDDRIDTAVVTLVNISKDLDKTNALETSIDIPDANKTNSSLNTSVTDMIINLQKDLDSASLRLISISEKVTSTTSDLGGTKETIDSISSTLAEAQTGLDEAIATLQKQAETDAKIVAAPLTVEVKQVREQGTHFNFLFPTILLLVLMFSSLVLGTTLVMMEKTSPAFVRNYFLPIKKTTFIVSIYATNIILSIIQIIIILALSVIFLPEALSFLPAVALVLFIASTIFTFIGMLLGYIFKSEETGVLASISVGSLILLISGIILPVEALAPWLRSVMVFNPFFIGEQLIRNIFIFQMPLAEVWFELLTFVVYAIVLFIIILLMENVLHKHLTERFQKHHHKKHRQKQKNEQKGGF